MWWFYKGGICFRVESFIDVEDHLNEIKTWPRTGLKQDRVLIILVSLESWDRALFNDTKVKSKTFPVWTLFVVMWWFYKGGICFRVESLIDVKDHLDKIKTWPRTGLNKTGFWWFWCCWKAGIARFSTTPKTKQSKVASWACFGFCNFPFYCISWSL